MKERSEGGYDHILKYTSLFGGMQGITILANLVRNKAMALFLKASGLGFNSMLYTAQTFASQCTSLGISLGAVPRLSEYFEQGDEEHVRYYIQVIRLWSMISAVLGFVFCLVMSPVMGNFAFNWGHHTHHYALLGFSVAAIAITGGETAILKATRRLGLLARIQFITAVASIIISLPLYYFLFHSGVLPAIILMAFSALAATVMYSYRCYPLQMQFSKSMLQDGKSMIRLGTAFILAAAVGSVSEVLVRSFLNVEGSLTDVGFYNAAYMITITYAGIIFSAMESDYFPRLSGVSHDIMATNEMVNKQIEVSLLILAPMLVWLLMLLPVLIPLLFSSEFLPMVAMAQVTVLAMYFKVLTMPVSYITLARSRSMAFLLLESAYFVVLVVAVIIGYRHWGIYGTGVALVVAHVCEYLLTMAYAYWKFNYRSTWMIVRYASLQMLLGGGAFVVSLLCEGWCYWIAEAALAIASTAYSIHVLRRKTHLWESLRSKFFKTA